MSNIHATAVVEDGAQIAATAEIGPFCVISSRAKIGENVRLIAHVTVMGDTTIGDGTIVFLVRKIMATSSKPKLN